jgi:cell division protein FtsW (lipid II flippase)
VLLVLVLVPGIGHSVNGSRRWLRVAGLNFQVSESRACCCWCTSRATPCVARPSCARPAAAAQAARRAAGAFVLLLLEPDFGAATVLFATGFGVLFLAGARLRDVLVLASRARAARRMIAMSSRYRVRRLTAFLDPWADPFNSGFQLTQSLIAIGRGEWFGVGLGESVQKLFYLPEAHTDFVFAVLAEEFGLIGVLVTLALFLAGAGARSRHRAARRGGSRAEVRRRYLAAASALARLQSFINIGVNMGVLPTKGLTLPLMSYGGSSLMVTLALAIGCCCASITRRAGRHARGCRGSAAAAHRRRRGRRPALGNGVVRHERARAHHGGRHRRARVPGAGARAALRERTGGIVARHAPRAWRRASCPPPAGPRRVDRVGGLRGKGVIDAAAAPFMLARALCRPRA